MAGNEEINWWKREAVGLLAILITLMSVAYWGVIKGNDDSNTIKVHSQTIIELKAEIKSLQESKVDKEILQMIQISLAEIKVDVRDVRLAQKYGKFQ